MEKISVGENLQFFDESEDKKYFTIIPNYIANHSTANDQALYFQMKKFAGETGTCFVAKKTLKEKLKIGHRPLIKSINYLLEHGWIEYVGKKKIKTAGGNQKVSSYKIKNIWKRNVDYYENEGCVKQNTPDKDVPNYTQGCFKSQSKGVSNGTLIRTISNKNYKEDTLGNEVAGNTNYLIFLFKEVNPSYERLYSNKTERAALKRLVKEYGAGGVEKMIKQLPLIIIKPYAPKVTTPYQLERDLGKIVAFVQQTKEQHKSPYHPEDLI